MNTSRNQRLRLGTSRRRAVALTAVGGVLASAGMAGLGPVGAQASSHREAPAIGGLPQYDNTDTYAFRSPDRRKSVTLVANWLPFEEPAGGPNFYSFATDARYNIKIDNNGDAKPDITYRWTFKDHYRFKNTFLYNNGPVTSLKDKNLNFFQTYRLTKVENGKSKVLVKSRKVAPSFVGDASMPDYGKLQNLASTKVKDGKATLKSYTGQAEDPFFLDLRIFDLLYGGDLSEVGDDTLAGFNVQTVALQVPRGKLNGKGSVKKNPIIGVWSTTDKRRGCECANEGGGKFRQISRLGNPLVNEVVIPIKDKDKFNRSKPAGDAQFLKYVTKPEVPRLIEAIYGIDAPATPRNDLVAVFLTGVKGLNQPKNVTPSEQLRLNMSTPVTNKPNRLGVIGGDLQGFPNGRRLTDDVVDIELQVLEGELVGSKNDLGDGVNSNDVGFGDNFPYVAIPESGSSVAPHDPAGAKNASATQDTLVDRVAPASALGLGLLAMVGGAVGMVRRRRTGE